MACREVHQISFEWTVSGLKELFEVSAGSAKSRVHKSPRFGREGQWQILLYPNAGTSGKEGQSEGQYASLFLSSEPTATELESAIMKDGGWTRDGIYKFSFEIRTMKGQRLFPQKEASNHVFSRKTANWGWAQFARRDLIFYGSPIVRADDAFVICCSITSSPSEPTETPTQVMQPVPKSLLHTLGQLLDDPLYSDVKFILSETPRRHRSVYAAKKMLRRAEYFQSMFSSDFAEGSAPESGLPLSDSNSYDAVDDFIYDGLDDSDLESVQSDDDILEGSQPHDEEAIQSPTYCNLQRNSAVVTSSSLDPIQGGEDEDSLSASGHERNVRQKTSHPSSPRSAESTRMPTPPPQGDDQKTSALPPANNGKKMLQVIIKDASFATFYSILYYLYTDLIYFAPLSSTFAAKSMTSASSPGRSPKSVTSSLNDEPSHQEPPHPNVRVTRKEWKANFHRQHPGIPVCSAKACYRLADRFGLQDVKQKASKHIRSSLTVDNIVLEIFSPFTAMFPEIRQFEVEFFLSNWHTIRSSTAMQRVWKQIRHGRHPGYEEVWPVIAMNLEFKPQKEVQGLSTNNSSGEVSSRS